MSNLHDRFQTYSQLENYYKRMVKLQFIVWFSICIIILSVSAWIVIPIQFKWNNLDKVWQQHAVLYDKWKQAHLSTIKDFEKAMTAEEQKYAKFEQVLTTIPQPTQ